MEVDRGFEAFQLYNIKTVKTDDITLSEATIRYITSNVDFGDIIRRAGLISNSQTSDADLAICEYLKKILKQETV